MGRSSAIPVGVLAEFPSYNFWHGLVLFQACGENTKIKISASQIKEKNHFSPPEQKLEDTCANDLRECAVAIYFEYCH